MEKLCALYWPPLYAFLRRRGETPADAQDHVQGFFARLVEKDFLQQVDAERGRFRTFRRAALWHYVLNERRAERAERRGGAGPPLSLQEFEGVESALAGVSAGVTPDEVYDRRWAVDLLRMWQSSCPLFEDRKTSNEVKKQKARPPEPAGVLEGEKNPTLRHITPLDLRRIDRLGALFAQAAHAGWMQPSEASALNFVAAAVRAREVGHDPARLFVNLVRQRLG